MSVIARCEGCGYEYIVRPDRTVSLACDCPLRDPDTPWSVVEMVPASQLQGAVDDLIAAAAAFERRFGGYGVAGEVREPLARALDRLQGGQ
jgi:hypothetical protein